LNFGIEFSTISSEEKTNMFYTSCAYSYEYSRL